MQDATPLASPDPDKARSDSPASGNRSGTDSDMMDKDDRLQLSEWLEEFAENLEDPEIHVPAHISQENSDSKRPTKLVKNSNKGRIVLRLTSHKTAIATNA